MTTSVREYDSYTKEQLIRELKFTELLREEELKRNGEKLLALFLFYFAVLIIGIIRLVFNN